MSLKARRALGAAALGAVALVTAAILWFGMNEVAKRLDAALAAEARMARYAALSSRTAGFLVVATEAIQTGRDAEARAGRLDPAAARLREVFAALHADLEIAVADAAALGLDAQSRFGAQSRGLARVEAQLDRAMAALAAEGEDPGRLRAHVDGFAAAFDPLLSQAVNAEVVMRNAALDGIERLRRRLMLAAFVVVAAAAALTAAFYFGLIRPQFARLDRLRDAAHRIGREDFAVALPEESGDEIGRLYAETNRTAAALDARRAEVRAEWERLNETIAERTEALRAANASLAEIDVARRRFFADVSHELRTPLTVILMEAEIGRKGGDAEAAFRTIEARAARLNRRIDDLLRIARSDSGQLALKIEPTDLKALVAEAAEEVEAEVDAAGMRLEAGEMPAAEILCDPNWLRQTIVSLIRNAVKHARAGGAVRLDGRVEAGAAEVAVSDGGPGVAPGDRDRVFERFEQGGRGDARGFGVGLALARWVTEAQGGEIALVSPLPPGDALAGPRAGEGEDGGPGTRITLRFPLSAYGSGAAERVG
ncbi:MAG: HAMP domain-containing sensor histidine kinase [Pseudomonadota bacterium]